jgi:hypothetical protein
MLNLIALGTMGKRFRKDSVPKKDQEPSRLSTDALVAPPARVSPAQAEHFVQFALQFLH